MSDVSTGQRLRSARRHQQLLVSSHGATENPAVENAGVSAMDGQSEYCDSGKLSTSVIYIYLT